MEDSVPMRVAYVGLIIACIACVARAILRASHHGVTLRMWFCSFMIPCLDDFIYLVIRFRQSFQCVFFLCMCFFMFF